MNFELKGNILIPVTKDQNKEDKKTDRTEYIFECRFLDEVVCLLELLEEENGNLIEIKTDMDFCKRYKIKYFHTRELEVEVRT